MAETKKAPAEKTEEVKVEKKAPAPAPIPDEKDLVTFRAFKDAYKYKDDIVVIVNGKTWRIKRGVEVMIPRYVYHALENARRQEMSAADTMQKFEEEYNGMQSTMR